MKAVQILMDERLIEEVDREAKRKHSDRSKLVRMALERFLAEVRRQERDELHRRGYERYPLRKDEVVPWEKIQEWPED